MIILNLGEVVSIIFWIMITVYVIIFFIFVINYKINEDDLMKSIRKVWIPLVLSVL